jgi:crotonobetaine/carnitine-CoA ligase
MNAQKPPYSLEHAAGPVVNAGRDVPKTVIEVLVAAATRRPDEAALLFEDGVQLTTGNLMQQSATFAAYLSERIDPGDRVACAMGNRAEFFVAWFATVAAGGVFVAVNPDLEADDGRHVLSDSGTVLVVCDAQTQPMIERCREGLDHVREVVVLDGAEPYGLARGEQAKSMDLASWQPASTDEPTNIYYTSGSTGRPKGCLIGHAYWRQFVDMHQRDYPLRPGDRILCCLRFFYNDPTWMLLSSLHHDSPLVVMRNFSVSRFWGVVRDFDVTQLVTIASIPALLLTRPEDESERDHRVGLGIQTGLDPSLQPEMQRRWGFPWVDVYGLTEVGAVTGVPVELAAQMEGTGSIGRPKDDVEVMLVDAGGARVGVNEPGEIVTRSAGMMLGYLNRPEETAAAIDSEGWFHTGDIARQDDEGWLYFLGRQKDIVRRSGVNISSAEVEEAIRASSPDVVDVAVVATPSQMRGEEVLAHVYTHTVDEAGLFDQIIGHLEQRLAAHKVPRYVQFRSADFPRLASMRIAKQRLDRDVHGSTYDREATLSGGQGGVTPRGPAT